MSLCKHCNKEFIIAPSRRSKIKECKRTVCNSCTVSKRRWKSKIELIAKLGGKCQRCGFVGHPGSYHFHHKDPSKKLFQSPYSIKLYPLMRIIFYNFSSKI